MVILNLTSRECAGVFAESIVIVLGLTDLYRPGLTSWVSHLWRLLPQRSFSLLRLVLTATNSQANSQRHLPEWVSDISNFECREKPRSLCAESRCLGCLMVCTWTAVT